VLSLLLVTTVFAKARSIIVVLPMIERPTTERGRGSQLTSIVWSMQDVMTVRKNLGARVRALREKRKWSQEDLAHESGLARSFTGAIERGEKDLRLTTLVKLANTFDITVAQLFKQSVWSQSQQQLPSAVIERVILFSPTMQTQLSRLRHPAYAATRVNTHPE